MEREAITKTILIVEDNVGLNVLLTEKVLEWGYFTVSVHTGNEAIEWLKTNTPYLIILDYSLPDMNGQELLEIMQSSNTPIPPFIVSTGQGDEAIAVDMMKLGAKDYLVKNMHFLNKMPEVLKRIEKEIENEAKRKQAETLLDKSETVYKNLVEVIPDGIYKSTHEGRFITVNPAMVSMFGYSSMEELLAIDIKTQLYFHVDDREKVKLQENNAKIGVYRMKKKDGSEIWVEDHGWLTFDEETNILYHEGIMRDVTQRIKDQKALRKSEAIQNKMVSNIGDVIVIIDQNGINRFKSSNIEKWFGWKPEELVGKSTWDNVHPDDLNSCKKIVAEIIKVPDSSVSTELRYKRKDGDYVWIKITLTNLLLDPDIQGLLGNYHDITFRKNYETEIVKAKLQAEESEKKLLEAQRIAKLGSWQFNIETNEIFWSNELYNIFEIENITQNFYEFCLSKIDEEDRQRVSHINKQARELGKPFDFEYRIKTNSGKIKYIHEVGYANRNKEGKLITLFGTAQDITEQKLAQLELIASEQKYREMADSLPVGVFETDLQGNVTFLNKTVRDWLGYSPDEFQNNANIINFVITEDQTKASERSKMVMTEKVSAIGEYTLKRKMGDTFPAIVSSLPIIKNNNVVGLRGTVVDISERKQAENERETLLTKVTASLEETARTKNILNEMMERVSDGFVAFDKNFDYTYVNSFGAKLLNRKPEELIGKNYWLEYPEAKDTPFANAYVKAFETQEPIFFEDHYIHWDRWFSNRIYPSKDGITIFFSDITDSKKANEALQNERILLRTLIDNIPDAIYLKDINGRKTISNLADVQNIGAKSESEVLGKTDFELFPKEIAERFFADDQLVLKSGIPILNSEEYLFDEKKQPKWLLSSKLPFRNNAGQIIGLVGIGRDITAQKLEESIVKAYNAISDFSFQASLDQLLQKTLDEIEKLTNSSIGFIHFVDSDQVTLTLQMWSTNTLLKMCKASAKGLHYPIDKAGIWVDCVHARSPIIHNNYEAQPHKKGLPEGHAPITRELVVPIFRNEKIVAILGVGNKETDYDQADLQTVSKLANLAWEITERHQAKEALRKSEVTHKEMIANISDVITIIGNDGKIKYKSPNIEKWFGWLPEDLVGKNAWETVHPDDLEHIQTEFYKILEKENSTKTVEYRYKCKQGNYKMIELTAINLSNDSIINGVLMNYKDITKRKLRDIEILNTKNRLKTAQAIAHVGNWEIDLQTKRIWASDEAFNIYGITNIDQYIPLDTIQQKPLPEYRPLLDNALKLLITNNEPYDLVFQILHGFDNEKRSIHSIAELEKDTNGNPSKVIGIIQDITEQKKLENELRKLYNAVEQNPASIVITNTKGDIEYVNPKFVSITGYSLQEALGNNPRILKTDTTSPQEYKHLWATITKGKIWKGEFCNKRKDGSLYWESAIISPVFNTFGKITHYVAVKEDITEKKETERKIMSAVIEGEERERNRFSKELHDGLGPLLSTVKLYFQWVSETDELQKKEFLAQKGNTSINEAIQTLREISNNLSPRSLNTFGLNIALTNYLETFTQIEGLSIKFNSNIEQRFNKSIELALYRIVTELFNNSSKYAKAKEITINLNYEATQHHVELFYSDDGIGFDIEAIQKFGNGNGIVNIQSRVSTLNGKINIKSAMNHGMQVAISIPVTDDIL